MALSTEEIKKIAHLARFTLSEDEVTHYTEELSKILEMVKQLDAVDVTNIEVLTHPLALTQRLRKDEVTLTDNRARLQALAPLVKDGLYLVPSIIEKDKE